MSQPDDFKESNDLKKAQDNFDDIMRRIKPFIKKPVEQPREPEEWISPSGLDISY